MTASPNLYRPFEDFEAWSRLSSGAAWGEYLDLLNEARAEASAEVLQETVGIALRAAALETGAIENLYQTSRGITQTVAVQGALWEAKLDEIGPDVRGHFDAQLAAFELVLDAATQQTFLSEAWLRRLHEVVCANQASYRVLTSEGWLEKQLIKRKYKTEPNNVTLDDGSVHWYAPELDVPMEMRRLVDNLRSEAFEVASPSVQAAYAHYTFVAVHPFSDGNGRVARALASVFLYRAVGLPLVIYSDQQLPYWNALATGDSGSYKPFADFIEDRVLDTMTLVRQRLVEAKSPLSSELSSVRALLTTHGGLTHAEVQATAQRFTEKLSQTFQSETTNLELNPDLSSSVQTFHGERQDCNFWERPYRILQQGGRFTVHLNCSEPVQVRAEVPVFVGVARELVNPFAFIAIDASRPLHEVLQLRVSDILPEFTAAALEKIEGWVRSLLRSAIADLGAALHQAIKNAGL